MGGSHLGETCQRLTTMMKVATVALFMGLVAGAAAVGCNPPYSYTDATGEVITCPSEADDPNHDVVYAVPSHCSMYIDCYNGCGEVMGCKPGLLFDEGLSRCEFAETVNCGTRSCDGLPCCTDCVPNVILPDFQCPVPTGLNPYPDNCIKYVQCDNGKAILKTCEVKNGLQLLWRSEKVYCDYPDQVNCGNRPICDVNDENCRGGEGSGGVTDEQCQLLLPQCPPGGADGYLEVEKCNACACRCLGGSISATCPCTVPETYFDVEQVRCRYFSENPECF